MSAIRNSISLQDRMTPVFRSIIRSMDSTLRVMRNLDKQANKGVQSKAYRAAERDLKRANNELIKMQNNLNRADKYANKLASSSGRVSSNMMSMRSGGFNLTNLASGLYLLRNIANVLDSIMETPDTLRAIQYRLDTYDTTGASGGALFDAAYQAALNSRSDVESTANLASRILTSGATKGSGAQAIYLSELLNKSSFLGGSSSEESKRALLQLSQALSSGVLQGDELRAIREQAPGLTDVLSKGLSSMAERGVLPRKFIDTTMGDLKQLGADGELTADRVIAAFMEMEDYINETFENSPKQFGQAITGIANVWKRWLKLLGEGDNALARINNAAWDLYEWFTSDEGTEFMNNLAAGVNFVVDCIFNLVDSIGDLITWFNELDNSTQIVQAALITVGILAAATAAYMIGAWIASTWPILLAAAAIGLVIYALLEAGYTADEIIGGICGAVAFLAYLIWDIIAVTVVILYRAVAGAWNCILDCAMNIINSAILIGTIAVLVICGIVQLVLWAVVGIIAYFKMMKAAFQTFMLLARSAVENGVIDMYSDFVDFGVGVLKILQAIGSAIDWIFGSNLADTVGGWIGTLETSLDNLYNTLDPEGEKQEIETIWKNTFTDIGDMYAGNGKYDDFNIIDNMANNWDTGMGLIDSVTSFGESLKLDKGAMDDWLSDSLVNPLDGWNAGYDWGSSLFDSLSSSDMDSSLITNVIDLIENGVGINGGNLDSVGSIKNDVDISDEDIKLLRDIAARDFLVNLKSVTPSANITFGDIRETADVNEILEVIMDMVDEELATSLVTE